MKIIKIKKKKDVPSSTIHELILSKHLKIEMNNTLSSSDPEKHDIFFENILKELKIPNFETDLT